MKNVILILFVMFSVGVCVVADYSVVLFAQEPTEDPKAVQLTELESANVLLLVKDVQLGNQGMQLVQAQFQAAVAGRDGAQAKLAALVGQLRGLHKAPEAEFTFNVQTMSFVPIPPAPEEPKKEG